MGCSCEDLLAGCFFRQVLKNTEKVRPLRPNRQGSDHLGRLRRLIPPVDELYGCFWVRYGLYLCGLFERKRAVELHSIRIVLTLFGVMIL